MEPQNPIPYQQARLIALGDGIRPIIAGHSIALRLCYPVASQDGLFVFGRGNDLVEEELQFAAIVREVWQSLPPDDRRAMVTFWRGQSGRCLHLLIEWAPQIEFTDGWFTHGAGNAACTLDETVFFFHRPTLARESPYGVRRHIAHEFSHAFQRAIGISGQQTPVPVMSEPEREQFLMQHFGFSTSDALRRELFFRNRTTAQMVAYIYSDDESRTEEILKRWGYPPEQRGRDLAHGESPA